MNRGEEGVNKKERKKEYCGRPPSGKPKVLPQEH